MYTTIILFVGFTAAYSLIWHFQSSNADSESHPGPKATKGASRSDAPHPGKAGAERNR